MIKEIVATGADANAAIESGALLLGLPRDEVQFEIIDLPRKGGFLGLKKLPAKVRVWAELPDEKPARSEKPRRQEAPRKENKPPRAERAEKPARPEKPVKTEKPEKSEKPRAIEEEKAAPVEIEPTDEVRAKVEKAAAYVSEILTAMGVAEFTLTPRYYEENVRLQLSGEQIGGVIGRRGETLDAIQHLTNYAVNRGSDKHMHISVDAESYRAKREESLVRLAEKMAAKAIKYKRSMALEPMNSYERHVIHTALQDYEGVTTSSTGTEPNRRVVVSYEKPQRTSNKPVSREWS